MSTAQEQSSLKIILADDHTIVRHAIKTILENIGNYQVIAEAEDADSTVKLTSELNPDVLILDLGLPKKSGLEALYEIRARGSNCKVVVLTMYDDEVRVRQALAAGANAYLLKNSSPQEFAMALNAVTQGQTFLTKKFEHLLDGRGATTADSSDPLSKLSQREREVFYLLADGMPNRVIAKKLYISARTVETHRARVIKKMGFSSTADLIRYAIRNNLLSL